MNRILSLAIVLTAALVGACTSLPSQQGRPTSFALADTTGTRLGSAVSRDVASHPGKAGIHALPLPHDAFAVRVLLASAAEKSLDLQYYIWHEDRVGSLMFEALWLAAERGVRVRLLLDDLNTSALDSTLAALDAHPGIDVRLYNPFVERSARALGFVADFTRLNRRMHNKAFIADGQVAVVGGRNIGDEYLGAGSGVAFTDLDVVAVGAVVADVSKVFDLYWNSASAYPAANVVPAGRAKSEADLKATFHAMHADPESAAYLRAARETAVVKDLLDRRLVFEWVDARVVYDDPSKTLDAAPRRHALLFPDLLTALGRPARTLDVVSPYFVPGVAGTEALAALAREGVKVRVLTNSLAASDVKAVHAGYAKRRRDLLRAGVELYELKSATTDRSPESKARLGSSSSTALHAKTFAVDRERIFVGSFNFDPRSALLNTEMGIVLASPVLAQRLAAFFDADLREAAYQVRLASDGRSLEWIEQTPAGARRFETEPGTSWFLRMQVEMLSILPIDPLL